MSFHVICLWIELGIPGLGPHRQQVLRNCHRREEPPHPELIHGNKRLRSRWCQQQGDRLRILPGG